MYIFCHSDSSLDRRRLHAASQHPALHGVEAAYFIAGPEFGPAALAFAKAAGRERADYQDAADVVIPVELAVAAARMLAVEIAKKVDDLRGRRFYTVDMARTLADYVSTWRALQDWTVPNACPEFPVATAAALEAISQFDDFVESYGDDEYDDEDGYTPRDTGPLLDRYEDLAWEIPELNPAD